MYVACSYIARFISNLFLVPLLYTAVLSRDQPMVTSILKRTPNLDITFRDTNSHSTPSECTTYPFFIFYLFFFFYIFYSIVVKTFTTVEPKYSTLLTKGTFNYIHY